MSDRFPWDIAPSPLQSELTVALANGLDYMDFEELLNLLMRAVAAVGCHIGAPMPMGEVYKGQIEILRKELLRRENRSPLQK